MLELLRIKIVVMVFSILAWRIKICSLGAEASYVNRCLDMQRQKIKD